MIFTNVCTSISTYPPLVFGTILITFIAITSSMLLKKMIPNQMYQSLKKGRPEFSIFIDGGGSAWKMIFTTIISLEYFLITLKVKKAQKSWFDFNMITEKNRLKFSIYSFVEVLGLVYFFVFVFLINGLCELLTYF